MKGGQWEAALPDPPQASQAAAPAPPRWAGSLAGGPPWPRFKVMFLEEAEILL